MTNFILKLVEKIKKESLGVTSCLFRVTCCGIAGIENHFGKYNWN